MKSQQPDRPTFVLALAMVTAVHCGGGERLPAIDALPASVDPAAQPEDGGSDNANPEGSAGDAAGVLPQAASLSISVAPGAAPGTAEVSVALADTSELVRAVEIFVAPDNLRASAETPSLTLVGLLPQVNHVFTATATTLSGNVLSTTSAPLAFYDVVETFIEPMCASNTIFAGSFSFDTQNRIVSNLRGSLTEAMHDGPPTVSLAYELSTRSVTLGGVNGQLVATFALDATETFLDGGCAPGGSKTYGNRNAYALIFVNSSNPAAAATADQIDWLAYADCTSNGLMGNTCMTGTSATAYGHTGTMGAYPVSQVTTQR